MALNLKRKNISQTYHKNQHKRTKIWCKYVIKHNFLSIISLNHPHSYLPGKSPMYVCNQNLGVLLKKKIAIKKQKSTITTLKNAKSFYNIQGTFSLTFSFCVDRKRPFFLSKQNTEVSFEYKQQLTLRPRRLRTNNCF